jgi:uncharacterized protein YukE
MPLPTAATTVTVPNHWDLHVTLPIIYGAAYSWEVAAGATPAAERDAHELATEVLGCSWQGPAADTFKTRQTRLWSDIAETSDLSMHMSNCLHDVANVLRTAQEQLDQVWLRLRRRVQAVKVAGSSVRCVVRTPADEALINKAIGAAHDIREHATNSLECIVEVVDRDIVTRMYQLVDALTQANDSAVDWTLPPGTYATTIVRIGNDVFVTRGASSRDDPYNIASDEVTVTVDRATGEQIVTVNGVEHRFSRDDHIVVRDGLGHGTSDQFSVAGYSPSPGINVDRTGSAVHVTAKLEVSGEDASPEKAAEIEEKIRTSWNRRFPDGTSVVTDVKVTFRPPGVPAAPDATQIVMAKIPGASHVDENNTMHLNTVKPDATNAVPHEFGHQIGLKDRYYEPILSKVRNHYYGTERYGTATDPGYEKNIMGDGGPVSGQNLRDLASENPPSYSTSDDQIRDWVSRGSTNQLATLATTTKINMINTLMDGLISDQDVTAIESICRTARSGDQADAVRAAVAARLGEMWGSEQQARLRAAIDAMPRSQH